MGGLGRKCAKVAGVAYMNGRGFGLYIHVILTGIWYFLLKQSFVQRYVQAFTRVSTV